MSAIHGSNVPTGSALVLFASRPDEDGLCEDRAVKRMLEAGLGQDYASMRLARCTQEWLSAGAELRDRVAEILDGITAHVEAIGSSSVLGLLSKPIIDLAVGLAAGDPVAPTAARLESHGWVYRGDAGADGGHVFVLEARPWHRVAHLHVVEYDGDQWRRYLQLREVLRGSPEARQRYEAVKIGLAQGDSVDRKAYTSGKSEVVRSLLEESNETDDCQR